MRNCSKTLIVKIPWEKKEKTTCGAYVFVVLLSWFILGSRLLKLNILIVTKGCTDLLNACNQVLYVSVLSFWYRLETTLALLSGAEG